ncbi:MAG: DNA repair protein RecO [Deltaproteobacteria bacterium]|nr:DNA repair protein RecO [Deltaproteobacteria bacterium]
MKRGLYRAQAIILNSFDYGESDRIIAFYTLEHGKIKGIAKGARRSKKRFVGNLEPGSLINLIFFQSGGSELVRVEDVTLVEGFHRLRADIDTLSYGFYLLELTSEMTREGVVLPAVYELLAGMLKMLNDGHGPGVVARFFEIRLLSLAGYMPHLSGCVVCKNDGTDGPVRKFSSEKGGVVCGRCAPGLNSLLPISPSTAGLLSMAARMDADKLARLKPAQSFIEEGERLLYDFIKFQLGRELKTRRFMEKMRAIETRAL